MVSVLQQEGDRGRYLIRTDQAVQRQGRQKRFSAPWGVRTDHRRVGRSWSNRIQKNSGACQLDGKAAGETDDGALRRRVVGGGDRDDRTASTPYHPWHNGGTDLHCAHQVHLKHPLPLGIVDVSGRHHLVDTGSRDKRVGFAGQSTVSWSARATAFRSATSTWRSAH
jgi:hypothetical protein